MPLDLGKDCLPLPIALLMQTKLSTKQTCPFTITGNRRSIFLSKRTAKSWILLLLVFKPKRSKFSDHVHDAHQGFPVFQKNLHISLDKISNLDFSWLYSAINYYYLFMWQGSWRSNPEISLAWIRPRGRPPMLHSVC